MKHTLLLSKDCGAYLADGAKALEYRRGNIDPYMGLCEQVLLDFTGVRMANSSFMNALVSGLIEQHGEESLKILQFIGYNPILRVLIESAVQLGLQKNQALHAAG
jgi:hypothetical protein